MKKQKKNKNIFFDQLKKSGWAIILAYIFLVFSLFASSTVTEAIIILVLICILILYDYSKRNKTSNSPFAQSIRILFTSVSKLMIILIGVGVIFSPAVGPVGIPWSFFLAPAFFIFLAHMYFLAKNIGKNNKFEIFWSLLVLIYFPIAIYLSSHLFETGINKMKLHAVETQRKCNLEKKCSLIKEPWTKDYKKIEIKNNSFKTYITFSEEYYTFNGGYNKDLTLEIHNVDTDFSGKNKKYFIYKDNKWIQTNE